MTVRAIESSNSPMAAAAVAAGVVERTGGGEGMSSSWHSGTVFFYPAK